jgi:hypothetical protein
MFRLLRLQDSQTEWNFHELQPVSRLELFSPFWETSSQCCEILFGQHC